MAAIHAAASPSPAVCTERSTKRPTLARSKRRGRAGQAGEGRGDGENGDDESSNGRGPLAPDTPAAPERISGERNREGVPGGGVVVLRRRLVPEVERGGRGDETGLVLDDRRHVELRVPAAGGGEDDP